MQGQDRPPPPVDAGARSAGAPAPGATGRELLAGLADGCTDAIIGTSLDFAAGVTRLSMFDASRIADGPLAVASLPYAIPLGFHGAFVAA